MTREETIKWLESLKAEIGKSEHRTLWHYAEAIDTAIEALDRQKGKWIEGDMLECNQCHHRMIIGGGAYNFCPNCGADMRGDTE